MSSRPQFSPYAVIKSGDMSTQIISEVTIIQKLSLISYTIVWTGTSPIGSMSVQVSNDYKQNVDGSVKDPGNWNTLPLSAATDVAGDSDCGFIDIDAMAGYALRLVYNPTSGVGVMQATVAAKVA